jgi:hypothetical protein
MTDMFGKTSEGVAIVDGTPDDGMRAAPNARYRGVVVAGNLNPNTVGPAAQFDNVDANGNSVSSVLLSVEDLKKSPNNPQAAQAARELAHVIEFLKRNPNQIKDMPRYDEALRAGTEARQQIQASRHTPALYP